MKICLLGATVNTNNMGVGALSAGAVNMISHQFPDAEICVLDYDEDPLACEYSEYFIDGHKVRLRIINLRFSKKIYLKNNIALLLFFALLIGLIPSKKTRRRAYSLNPYLKQLDDVGMFAAISGGDSFSDIYGMARLIYVSLPQFLVLLMRKNLVVLPQTLGPFKRRTAKWIARFIFKGAKAIYSRDYAGREDIPKLMGGTHIMDKFKFCYDVGFLMSPLKPHGPVPEEIEKWKRAGFSVDGLNVSGLLLMGGYSRDNMFGLKVGYRDLLNDIIRLMIDKGAHVLLVPHVFGDGGESDMAACEKIYNELKPVHKDRIAVVRGSYNQNEIKYIIGQCDFFIGARMHACIAALSQNIPAVSIAYSKKFRGVMQTIGMDALVADPRTMDKGEILRIIASSFEIRHSLSGKLAAKMPEVKYAVRSIMRDIYSLSNGNAH